MLCDPIPEPNYKREILISFATGEASQIVNDLVWLAFDGGWKSDGLKSTKMEFRQWLSKETGLDLEQININWGEDGTD